MKIYQVIKCTGSYEDYYERVLGTFTSIEKAKTLKDKECLNIELKRESYEKCNDCDNDKECFCVHENYPDECKYREWEDFDEVYASFVIREFDITE